MEFDLAIYVMLCLIWIRLLSIKDSLKIISGEEAKEERKRKCKEVKKKRLKELKRREKKNK